MAVKSKVAAVKIPTPMASSFRRPLTASLELAAIIGTDPMTRQEVVSRIFAYIEAHGLRDEANQREIVADDKLALVLGKGRASMTELQKHIARHLT